MREIELPDFINAGIYDSKLAVKNRDITKNRKVSMFEIELPCEEGGLSYIDNDKYKIRPDGIICAKPGQIRHTKLPFRCHYIHISAKSGVLYDILMSTPDCFIVKDAAAYRDIFISLCTLYNNSLDIDRLMIHSLILKLIHSLYSDSRYIHHQGKLRSSNYDIIERAIDYISENYTQNLQLEDIAKYVSLSPVYFHNSFKAATGKTPHQYLSEVRIKKAANLLVSTDLSLSQIAYECGFSSQSYFSYAFKKTMNLTPREYMQKMFEQY